MSSTDQVENRYEAPLDPDAPNNSHAFALQLIGSSKRVLELGPATGYFTRELVARGCRVVAVEVDPAAAEKVRQHAERVIVGDLADPEVIGSAVDAEGFDVVVAGDVLEHLPDPLRVLRACRAALKPGGYVVLSVPNIAHADIKLQLLAGRFPYRDTGLLDRTHLHFFTRDSLEEMLRDAGLLVVDLRRVVLPVFSTEQAVDPAEVSPEVLAEVVADAESETYQFVARALLHDGDAEMAHLAERAVSQQLELDQQRVRGAVLEAELAEARKELTDLRAHVEEAVAEARRLGELAAEHERHIEALRSTRSYRMLAPLRALFGRRG